MTTDGAADVVTEVIARLIEHGFTIAVAESLTGGLLVAELIGVPGASATVFGGVIAYNTALKHSVIGVDADLLAQHGPVHPEVARQMHWAGFAAAKLQSLPKIGRHFPRRWPKAISRL